MELLIKAGGIYCLAFAVFHLMFWRLFDWGEDLSSLTFLNRQVMQVLNLSLTAAFLVFAYVSFAHAGDLLTTSLGKALLVSMALFWLARAVQQVVFFKLKHWQSVIFFLVFLLGAALYGVPAFGS